MSNTDRIPFKKITCKCPKCEKKYKRQYFFFDENKEMKHYTFWSGKGIPRAFCTECKTKIKREEEEDETDL